PRVARPVAVEVDLARLAGGAAAPSPGLRIQAADATAGSSLRREYRRPSQAQIRRPGPCLDDARVIEGRRSEPNAHEPTDRPGHREVARPSPGPTTGRARRAARRRRRLLLADRLHAA